MQRGKNHGTHEIVPPPGKWAMISEPTPGRTMWKHMQLMIKGDKDPENRPRGPSEQQECLLCLIPRKLRELYGVRECRDAAYLFLNPHRFPEPRDHSTTTEDSLFFLSIHPPVPLAMCPVHSTPSCVQGCLTEAHISTGSSHRACGHSAF